MIAYWIEWLLTDSSDNSLITYPYIRVNIHTKTNIPTNIKNGGVFNSHSNDKL